MKLTGVTLSGVDETVKVWQLCVLHDDFPFVEFGILRSKSHEGAKKRYPGHEWISKALTRTHGVPFAFHLCGAYARQSVDGPFYYAIQHNDEFRRAARIQVNLAGTWSPAEIERVIAMSKEVDKKFIVQETSPAFLLYEHEFDNNVDILVDSSGGTGKVMDIPRLIPDGYRIGFAGGITPNNVRGILEGLTAIESDNQAWIDMESGVRTDDCFDLDKARAVLRIAKEFVND